MFDLVVEEVGLVGRLSDHRAHGQVHPVADHVLHAIGGLVDENVLLAQLARQPARTLHRHDQPFDAALVRLNGKTGNRLRPDHAVSVEIELSLHVAHETVERGRQRFAAIIGSQRFGVLDQQFLGRTILQKLHQPRHMLTGRARTKIDARRKLGNVYLLTLHQLG